MNHKSLIEIICKSIDSSKAVVDIHVVRALLDNYTYADNITNATDDLIHATASLVILLEEQFKLKESLKNIGSSIAWKISPTAGATKMLGKCFEGKIYKVNGESLGKLCSPTEDVSLYPDTKFVIFEDRMEALKWRYRTLLNWEASGHTDVDAYLRVAAADIRNSELKVKMSKPVNSLNRFGEPYYGVYGSGATSGRIMTYADPIGGYTVDPPVLTVTDDIPALPHTNWTVAYGGGIEATQAAMQVENAGVVANED